MSSKITFIGEIYQGAENDLGQFDKTLKYIIEDHAFGIYGKSALKPTDIEVIPEVLGDPFFVIRYWHETGGSDFPARLQIQDFTMRIGLNKEDMFAITEDGHEYKLTTRESLLLIRIGGLAVRNTFLDFDDFDE